jgi:hypothetical protein
MSLEEKEELAESDGLDRETQIELSQDKSEWVRLALSKNVVICEEAALNLAKDESVWIRVNLAWNSQLSDKVRQVLASDSEEKVAYSNKRQMESSLAVAPQYQTVIDLNKLSAKPAGFPLSTNLASANDRELTKNFLDGLLSIARDNQEVAKDVRLKEIVGETYASYISDFGTSEQEKLSYRDQILKTFLLDKELVRDLLR